MNDIIILTDRDEVQDLIGDDISDEQWLDIKEKLARHKGIWQAIDGALHEIVAQITLRGLDKNPRF